MIVRSSERGAALLTVLLLVAIMAVVTTLALDRLLLSTRVAQNSVAADQAAAVALAAEHIAAARIGDLVKADPVKTVDRVGWLSRPQTLPVPGGIVTARIVDAGNCFNLNSVVDVESDSPVTAAAGDVRYTVRTEGILQLAGLMRLLGIEPARADAIARATADWIDSDLVPVPGGAEDQSYAADTIPYRTGNGLMADASEFRVVAGVTPDVYQRVRPWICALPDPMLSPININTLQPQQAVLLSMIAPQQLPVARARQVLAQRPRDGYGSLVTFWTQPNLATLNVPSEASSQTKLTSSWFRVEMDVQIGERLFQQTALFDASQEPVRLVSRFRGERE